MEGIRRALVLSLVLIEWTAIEQAPSVGTQALVFSVVDFLYVLRTILYLFCSGLHLSLLNCYRDLDSHCSLML